MRVRCTTRAAARGDDDNAWVSSTFWRLFTPLTICDTTRRITKCRTTRSTNAPTRMPTIANGTWNCAMTAPNPAQNAVQSNAGGAGGAGARCDHVDGLISILLLHHEGSLDAREVFGDQAPQCRDLGVGVQPRERRVAQFGIREWGRV